MKGKKLVSIIVATYMMTFTSTAYGKVVEPKAEDKVIVSKEDKKLEEIKGKVVKVNITDKGKYILIGEGEHPTAVLVISKNTELVNSKGDPLSIYDLKEGMSIKAYHNGIATKSLPPQYPGVTKVVVDTEVQGSLVTDGFIYSVNNIGDKGEKEIWIKGERRTKNSLREVILLVNTDTEILDQMGNKLTPNDLNEKTVVEVVYGNRLAMSLPAKGVAKRVLVRKDRSVVSGTIEKVEIGKTINRILVNGDYLNLSSDTEIINSKGGTLDVKELKKGMNVIGICSIVVNPSNPSQRYCYMLMVQDKAK